LGEKRNRVGRRGEEGGIKLRYFIILSLCITGSLDTIIGCMKFYESDCFFILQKIVMKLWSTNLVKLTKTEHYNNYTDFLDFLLRWYAEIS
jgi:hypothetical protein